MYWSSCINESVELLLIITSLDIPFDRKQLGLVLTILLCKLSTERGSEKSKVV